MRVNFPSANSGSRDSTVYSRATCVNPIAITCAKYHNVALTADGRCYTWGLHSDQLGIEKVNSQHVSADDWTTSEGGRRPRSLSIGSPSSSSASTISSPQLVVGMLPENTGSGHAVAVSASSSHTAVVTSDGHLYTWGSSRGSDVLGHKGVRWQPIPRKVTRVHRAVGVAAAKEHTVLLMGCEFPPLPEHFQMDGESDFHQPLSLQDSAAIAISRQVDLFNVVPISLVAHRLNCRPLIRFCDEFVRKNLDGVLAVGSKSDFAMSLSSKAFVDARNHAVDDAFHPFLYHLIGTMGWVKDGRALLDHYSRSVVLERKKNKKSKPRRVDPAFDVETKIAVRKTKVSEEVKRKIPEESSNVEKRMDEPAPVVSKKLFQDEAPGKAPSKFHCEVCGVSCPDSNSYELHINGKKHRNRIQHSKQREEKILAESMMAMKRIQLMETNHEDQFLLSKSSCEKTQSSWATNVACTPTVFNKPTKRGATSFQDILNEQQKSSFMSTTTPPTSLKTPVLTAGYTTTVASHSMKPHALNPGPSVSLGAFLKKDDNSKQPSAMSSVGASWGVKTGKDNGPNRAAMLAVRRKQHCSASSQSISFSDIQKEEESKRMTEDNACQINGNQWFVQQRERAASIGDIQEEEEKDREMQLLIEEQRRIEEDIMKRIKQEKKKTPNKTKNGRRRKPKSGKPVSKESA